VWVPRSVDAWLNPVGDDLHLRHYHDVAGIQERSGGSEVRDVRPSHGVHDVWLQHPHGGDRPRDDGGGGHHRHAAAATVVLLPPCPHTHRHSVLGGREEML